MRTYAIRLKALTTVDGIEYPADFQIGAITTEVRPLTLLGLVQFQHAEVEEITDAVDAEEAEADADADADADAEQEETADDDASDDAPAIDPTDPTDGPADLPLVDDNSPAEPQPEEVPAVNPVPATDVDRAIAEFVAAGLDTKTAEALVKANRITGIDELRLLMSDPKFDLIDLDDVGTVRAEKIKAAFPAE